jgi:hypothetical protein
MSIVSQANIITLLGLSSGLTDEEQEFIDILHPMAEGAVIQFLGYDPEQQDHTEYLPRPKQGGGPGHADSAVLDVTASHSHAIFYSQLSFNELQLAHIPLRAITTVHVDTDGYHGSGPNAFESATEWTEGDDFYGRWDQDSFGLAGHIVAVGSWPSTPGSVKVVYRAGYSPAELTGTATAGANAGGTITTGGINASPIRHVVLLVAARSFRMWQAMKKRTTLGYTAGPLKSEKLGDYSYTIDTTASNPAGLAVSLTPGEERLLEAFRHYGIRLL